MEAFSAGTLAGAGSFRCDACGFPVALQELDQVPACPNCGGRRFRRASMFEQQKRERDVALDGPPPWLEEAREALVEKGDYLAFEDDERVRIVPLQDGWTRIGRSLSAHVRFDDPTVSRRHALVYRDDRGARILDDRSLNGVFRNGERVELAELADGDELAIGRFRIYFMSLSGDGARSAEGVGSAVG
ncbi:MAG TPA: FHA domain-containing protein [Thermoleophilaceae bacterium]|jgi:predicted  nucleic acid-binding Zn-ribbon protein|nr:FHA domain-containing protein [Thermoleophilaceae bacterium]